MRLKKFYINHLKVFNNSKRGILITIFAYRFEHFYSLIYETQK